MGDSSDSRKAGRWKCSFMYRMRKKQIIKKMNHMGLTVHHVTWLKVKKRHCASSWYYYLVNKNMANIWFTSFHRIGPLGRFDLVVAISVCLCLCVSVPFHVVYFEAYFAPTSQSWMSNIFRDSEFMGKSAGKKWSQNWTFILGCGLKSPRKKKFVFCWFCLIKHGGNNASQWITSGWRVYP